MQIIDFHTHPFINNKYNSCFYPNIVNYDNFKSILSSAGITKICGSVIYNYTDFENIKKLNIEALELKKELNNFYIPGIHIHPNFVDESIKELNLRKKQGVNLVGELVPYYNGWKNYYNKNLHIIYEEISKLNMVVSLHTDLNTDMNNLELAIKTFPNISFVGAHPNQKELLNTHIKLLKKYDNYYLDLSGTGLLRYGMLKFLVTKTSSTKILFGTDFPICNPKSYVESVLFENLNTIDLENIFYNNSNNLLSF